MSGKKIIEGLQQALEHAEAGGPVRAIEVVERPSDTELAALELCVILTEENNRLRDENTQLQRALASCGERHADPRDDE